MFYKKKIFIAALTFTMFLLTLFINAQTIIVILKQPPPNQWHVEDMWQLNLINTTSNNLEIYLFATVEEDNTGIIFEGTSTPFTLEQNYSGPVNPGDLDPVDVEYPNDYYKGIFMRTGTLPAGTYTICVYVRSVNGEEMGYDCKMQIIEHASPPELINPVDETNVTEGLPVFLWLPPMPMNDFVNYTIKIVELLDGQVPTEAMEANPAFYIEEDIPATSFQFPISARPFESGINYAWKVTAISDNGLVIGESPVWSFKYEAAAVVIFEEPDNLELVSPITGQVYDGPASQPIIMFKWMPIDINAINVTLTVNPISISEVFYNLTIWMLPEYLAKKVEEGNTIIEEDLTDLEPYFVKEEIEGTSCVYPYEFDLVEIMSGYHYAWQIQTFCGVGQPIVGKCGKSEVRTFSVNLEQLVSNLDCDSIRKMLDNLKAQLKAKTKDCLDKADRLNGLKDNLSNTKNILNQAKKKKKSLEEKLNKDETSFNNTFNYLKQILGNEATLIEYGSSGDLKQKAAGQNYIGSGGVAIVFSDTQSAMDAFDRYRAVTGESIGACLKNIRKLRKQKETSKNALQKTKNNIKKLNSRITKLQNNISSLSNELKACRNEINNLRDKIAELINAYEECELAFDAAMQEAESLIEHVDEIIGSGINLSLDSLNKDLRELQSAIDDCCGTGCECSEMRSSLTQAQEHRQNANEFMKQARAKLKQAKEKVGTNPREANKLAEEASILVRNAKNELKNARNKIRGLAGNKCTPGTIKDKKTYKKFKRTKIVDIGLVPYEGNIKEFKKRMKDYEKSAAWISWVYKFSSVLENLGNLINSAFEFILGGIVDITQPADKAVIVDAILESWPKIIEFNEAMQMYYIVEGHDETKETWEECNECCKWVNKKGPVRKGPTVQKTIRAKRRIIKKAGEIDMRVKTNQSMDDITTLIKNMALWKCE
ncbi:MAG: hypothetical protein K8R41_06505 [Bacteroidales bacterium]|nr:hypothetical protein [Bacteroidales bacterium]